MTAPLRAALYLRVSTARQAEHDVSIPDQKRQGEAYCASRSYELVETFIEAGASATNDRRPEFQRMIEAGTAKPPAFDVVVVHSFSRFFRDHFELEFYVRKLAKNGVKLISITQEMGDDPMHVMMRQIMALFDEYQSKENAKHVLRAMNENARQGFWNGALPPIGYRIVAAEQRGSKTKKKLEIDPLHADTVRLIYRLQDRADQQGMRGFFPMVALVERTFRIDQNVGDVLHIADFPFAAPHLQQRIVGGRLRVGRIEQQHAAMPGTEAGGELPVLALDVVDDRRAGPGQERWHDQADALAGTGWCETQHMLGSVMTKVGLVEFAEHHAVRAEKPGRLHLSAVGPASGTVSLDVLRFARPPDRHADGDCDRDEAARRRDIGPPRQRSAAHRRRRSTTTRRRPAGNRPASPPARTMDARAAAGSRDGTPSTASRPRS